MYEPQCHGMQSLPWTSVKAVIYELFVFTKMSPFQNLMSAIPFVIEQYMADMLHVDPDLMRTPCLQNTLHQRHIAQTFEHTIVRHGMFADSRIGHDRHLHPVLRVTGDIADDRPFVLLHISPYQCTITPFRRFIKKLDSEIRFRIRCFCNDQQSGSILVDTVDYSRAQNAVYAAERIEMI